MTNAEPTPAADSGRNTRCAAVVLAALIAGCEGRFTADLATDPPADPEINQVQVSLLGLELRTTDGATTALEFRAGEPLDLLDLGVGDPLRLFTSEELPAGQYSGVRLRFDTSADATVVNTNGDVFVLVLADGAFAPVDFTVEDDESDSELLTLTLDLRQSLRFDDLDDEYTLTPHLRTVRTGDAAQIQGGVSGGCPVGTSLILGGAVYAFAGENVVPDDLDGVPAEPIATTNVVLDTGSDQFSYSLRFLPAGDYTLALTCRGNEDALGAEDDLEFGPAQGATVRADDILRRDFT
jgi:hypothetical protein